MSSAMTKFDTSASGRIYQLNDDLRVRGVGGRTMLTPGINGLATEDLAAVLRAVAAFSAFDGRNDPYGEHDCAILEAAGVPVLWKIDYYDLTLEGLSPDPADPDVTCRVLTIMLAGEY